MLALRDDTWVIPYGWGWPVVVLIERRPGCSLPAATGLISVAIWFETFSTVALDWLALLR